MINVHIIGAVNLVAPLPSNSSSASKLNAFSVGTRCIIKLAGRESFRTEIATSNSPTWNAVYQLSSSLLSSRSKENCRPFYLEYLDIDILDYSKNQNYGERIYEARIPLLNVGKVMAYKLLRVINSLKDSEDISIIDSSSEARVIVDLSNISATPEDPNSSISPNDMKRLQLCQVLSLHLPQFQHLYQNFDDWTYGSMIGCGILPGPRQGELVIDKHEAEWGSTLSVNAFGDRCTIVCRGTLFITELRIIFIPHDISGPSWIEDVLTTDQKINGNLTSDQILLVRKLTIQIPLGSIQDVRYHAENLNSTIMIFESKDGSSVEFKIRRHTLNSNHNNNHTNNRNRMDSSSAPMSSPTRQNRAISVDYGTILDRARLTSPLYKSGLDTEDIVPQLWCARVVDEINWRTREDTIWISWMKYLKDSCDKHFPTNESNWLKSVKQVIDFESEYQRLRIQDSNWILSDLNRNYDLCSTYPQTLVIPGKLTDAEVLECATHRSRGRIASLVWLHPTTKAPLCRSAQPMSGMSGSSNEADRKFCTAIRTSCPRGLSLRIADARPRLNANANAIQGKGFENITFLGGPKYATLVFLDIENIHVMRASYLKLKEGLMLPGLNGGSESNSDVISSSKWLYHISGLLRGASSIAESLILGHPILLHCSDGWDRTGQLSSLAQLLLDPFYRTIQGFFILISKEFCAYGYRFESRLGKLVSNSKEASPIFYQFLDAVYQLTTQFPSSFEFTSYFLQILSQASFSGYFSTFRGNCERERHLFMKQTIHVENLSSQDIEYSTVFCYIGILLRCPGIARLMLNSYYNPLSNTSSHPSFSLSLNSYNNSNSNSTSTSTSNNHMEYSSITGISNSNNSNNSSSNQTLFLRPKCSVNDMSLWREGIFGYMPDIATHFSKYSPDSHEYLSIQSHSYNRLLTYSKIQSPYLDQHYISRMEAILHYDSYQTNSSSSTIPYSQYWDPTSLSFRKQYAKMAISQTIDNSMSKKQITYAARILIWYRSEKVLRSSWKTMITTEIEVISRSPTIQLLLKRIYRALLQSEFRLKMKLRWMSLRLTSLWVRSILDDLIEDTLNRCIRTDAVVAPQEALESTYATLSSSSSSSSSSLPSLSSSQTNMMDAIGAAKSFSNKIRNLQWTTSKDRSVSPTPPSNLSTIPTISYSNPIASLNQFNSVSIRISAEDIESIPEGGSGGGNVSGNNSSHGFEEDGSSPLMSKYNNNGSNNGNNNGNYRVNRVISTSSIDHSPKNQSPINGNSRKMTKNGIPSDDFGVQIAIDGVDETEGIDDSEKISGVNDTNVSPLPFDPLSGLLEEPFSSPGRGSGGGSNGSGGAVVIKRSSTSFDKSDSRSSNDKASTLTSKMLSLISNVKSL